MLRIRIVSAGLAAAAIVVALAASAATAQTTTDNQPGPPLSLLAGLRPPHETKRHEAKVHETKAHAARAAVHAKTADRRIKPSGASKLAAKGTTKLARTQHNDIAATQPEEPPAPSAPSAAPANIWSAENNWSAEDVVPPADAATAAPLDAAALDSGPNTMVVSGETVQIASPDQVNELDLAADDDAARSAMPSDRHDPAPPARAVFAAPVNKEASASPVGSASWIAQVLAAVGGALAAGTVAWLLIGGGPQRMYG